MKIYFFLKMNITSRFFVPLTEWQLSPFKLPTAAAIVFKLTGHD